jgi:PKD repeat protein
MLLKIRLITLLYFCWFWRVNAQCTYLAYDGFDYSQQHALNALSGSTGWAGAWDVQNGNTNMPGYQTILGSLSFSSLQTTGNAASGGHAYLTAGRRLNTGSVGPFSTYVQSGNNGIGTNNNGILWVSYLLRKNLNNNEHVFIDLHNDNIPWCSGCAGQHIAAGYFGPPSDVSGQRRWTLRLNDNYYPSSITLVPGQDYFIVLRLQFSESGTQVDMYINPNLPAESGPSGPIISQSTSVNNVIRSMAVYLGNSPGNGTVDEIRFAGSYECAAPDPSIQVNLPPVAQFSMTPSSGQVPVTVILDASASYDPEGQPLNYEWNFGDGSDTATGVSVDHTYNVLGQIPVALTVTDNEGLTHTLYQTLTLLNGQNSFPCQTTVTCYQMPGCNLSNGQIRINTSGTIFSLVDSNQNTVAVQANNEYQNLPSGKYTLFVQGNSNACRDTFEIFLKTDSTTCQDWEPALCSMELGTNLSGFSDWGVERPMKNLFKHIRREIVSYTNECNCWDLQVMNQISTDDAGYPIQIPFPTTHGPTLVRFILSADGGNLRADSTYVLLWDGTGSFTWGGGVAILQNQPNRIVFSPTNNGNIFINITQSTFGDHIRNFRLVRPQHEHDDLINHPFYPVFMDKISPLTVLRFMDWGETNNNPNIQWQDRGHTNEFTYAGHQGVPYEIMIQLANITAKDV